jgi:toxin HigB-1
MEIRGFLHKGLLRLYQDGQTKGVPAASVDKLRKQLAFMQDMENESELRSLGLWKAHQLTGSRKGTWSLLVTANYRLTFKVDVGEREIYDVDLEDYH